MNILQKITTALILAGTFMGASAQEFLPLPKNLIYGEVPGLEISRWVRLNILGARDAPYPIVWLSPQHFGRHIPDVLIEFTEPEFKEVVAYIKTHKCPGLIDSFPGERLLQTTEYSEGKERTLCIMQKQTACHYLVPIASMAKHRKNGEVVLELLGAMECKKS